MSSRTCHAMWLLVAILFIGCQSTGRMARGPQRAPGADAPGSPAQVRNQPTAANPPMLDYANNGGAMQAVDTCDGFGFQAEVLPPGDYGAADPWTNFAGSPLNGQWSIIVTDLWGIDNGFIFDWTIEFDPNAVEDRSTYEKPTELARGVRWVLVNGVTAVEGGEPTGKLAGRALRRPNRN